MQVETGLKLTRRDFLKVTGLAGASLLLAKYGLDVFSKTDKVATGISSDMEFVPNICSMCSTACDIVVASKTINGKKVAIKIEGDPASGYNRGKICARGQSGLRRQYSPNRIKKPLIRDDANTKGTWQFRAVSWDEALQEIKNKVQDLTGGDLTKVAIVGGWVTCVNYRPFLLALLKTPADPVGIGWIVGTPLQHCVFASGLGIAHTIGTFNNHAEIIADYENSDFILLMRANSSVAGVSVPRGERLALAKKKGTKIVVVDPRFSETASFADEWIKIKPGTDSAFLLSVINVIVNEGLYDSEFLKKHTNAVFLAYEPTGGEEVPQLATDDNGNYLVYDEITGNIVAVPKEKNTNELDINDNKILPALEAPSGLTYKGSPVKTVFQFLKEKVSTYTPEWAETICDVPADTIRNIALEFGKAARPTLDTAWYGGRYTDAYMMSKLRAILMALKGMIDKEGGWIFTGVSRAPIMGWNNNGAPRMAPSLPGFLPVYNMHKMMAWPNAANLPSMFPAMSDAVFYGLVKQGKIKVVIIIGSNPIVSMYNREKWEDALKNTYVINIDVQVTDTMLYSDVVLPGLNYLEKVEAVRFGESPSLELVTRFKAADPPEGVEGKHFFEIYGNLLDIFDQVTGQQVKDLWFEKLKNIFGLTADEQTEFDNIIDRNDNANLANNFQRFFAWLFAKRFDFCTKFNLSDCSRDALIDFTLNKLKEGPIEVVPVEAALKTFNAPRNLQLPTPTGRVEIFSTIMYDAYQVFKSRFGYSSAWDPLLGWPGVNWKDGVDPTWKPDPNSNEFFVVHGKTPLMSFTSTTNNDLLLSLSSLDPMYTWVWIPESRAAKLGIKTGDKIKITSTKTNKSAYARAYVTNLIREDTVFIPSNFKGEFAEQVHYKEFYTKRGPFVNLTEILGNQIDTVTTGYRQNEYTVKIEKVE